MFRYAFFLLPFIVLQCLAQTGYEIKGKVVDESGRGIEAAHIFDINDPAVGTISNAEGNFRLLIDSGLPPFVIEFRSIEFHSQRKIFNFYDSSSEEVVIQLEPKVNLLEGVTVTDRNIRAATITKIDPKLPELLPSPTGNFESILFSLPGVSSSNELSSQYSVRGGNFDENLVYVNDFEVYRPFLVRSGQQEGFSFINPNMVNSIAFSAGGFEAKYGDKMSSVLDVKYKRPKDFAGSFSLSLLGLQAHLEGSNKAKNFTYLVGIRQKSNRYLLNALPTQGEYEPNFVDAQSFFTYDVSTNWQLQLIANYSRNRYLFRPSTLESSFGTVSVALQLRVAYEGSEHNTYDSFMTGVAGLFTSDDQKLSLKWLSSIYATSETEAFDIIGQYFIGEVENNIGRGNFGDVTREFGVGTYHDWARNRLDGLIGNFEHKGILDRGKHILSWGSKFQIERIDDEISEWNRIDSAGFSLPYNFSVPNTNTDVTLDRVLKTNITLNSWRLSGFVQDSWLLNSSETLNLTSGLRWNYWSVNKEFFLSPRAQLTWHPEIKNDSIRLSLRAASGLYFQPPFYRELRDLDGVINRGLKAQKSFHFVMGGDLEFSIWGRPFKFTTDLYYKRLWDLVPYDIDNVLIRYYGDNLATGHVMGVDFRLNGEFVQKTDSWVSLSFLSAKEDFHNDSYNRYFDVDGVEAFEGFDSPSEFADTIRVEPGLLSRPTDQRYQFNIFFQDYLPNNDNYKMHLNLVLGGPLPFGPPRNADNILNTRGRNALRSPIYARADIGFSLLLFEKGTRELRLRSWFNHLKSVWVSLEVFNLLGVSNTVSYSWIKVFNNSLFGIPNRLTSRRLNARLIVKF